MWSRLVAAFFAGVLCCALVMGAVVGVFYGFGDNAQAQQTEKWQSQQFSFLDAEKIEDVVGATEQFAKWVETMPETCDIHTIEEPFGNGSGLIGILAYYRCPNP